MRFTLDKGYGNSDGKARVALHVGPGGGYLRPWYVKLNRGPGNAQGPACNHSHEYNQLARDAYGKGHCGHAFPARCNSAFCGRFWCHLSAFRLTRPLVTGYTFRATIPSRYAERLRYPKSR
jgi:hypothetical protein